MTPAEHEARIDKYERLMLKADNRTDRAMHAWAFVLCIQERNAERSPDELAEIERQRGLRP